MFLSFCADIPTDQLVPVTNENGSIVDHNIRIGNIRFPAFLVEIGRAPDPRENLPQIAQMNIFKNDVFVCAYRNSGEYHRNS